MDHLPTDRRYTAEHEWVLNVAPRQFRVGITDYAQNALGDIVYIDVPSVGTNASAGQTLGEIESTKSVSDLYSPITGTVVEVNPGIVADPSLTNRDPYGEGWLYVIEGDESDALLTAEDYAAVIGAG